MRAEPVSPEDPRLQLALDELRGMIAGRFRDATFEVSRGLDDPASVHLIGRVDVENTDDVMSLVIDRMMELQVEDGLPIFVIPVRPPERAVEELRRRQLEARPAQGSATLTPR